MATAATQPDADRLAERLSALLGPGEILTGDAIAEDYRHDEALAATPVAPGVLVRPRTTEEVAAVVRVAAELGTPVTARGSGSGMCGACVPSEGGIVVSFERMAAILEIDETNHVAVVQPGVVLSELDERAASVGLTYPVYPGEMAASLGGNVATNAGGMRAVRYGVTRQHVLGLEVVLGTGEVVRTGGRISKSSSGYDLTQLVIGSEGTLALVTEATLKLQPRLRHRKTILAPFAGLDEVVAVVPAILATGVAPTIVEYLDWLTLAAAQHTADLSLGLSEEITAKAQAYLVLQLENNDTDRLDADVQVLGELVTERGAVDAFVLDGTAAHKLITARENAFWTAKAAGAHEIVDVVVPRGAMPEFLATARKLAEQTGSGIAGCGHAGDGNVHLAVFQADPEVRYRLLHGMFSSGVALGGAISGEHGIGRDKRRHFHELTDPALLALMSRVKAAFDPSGVLNPGVLLDLPTTEGN